MKKINIGIIGLGTVGSGVIEILQKNKSLDVPIAISKIAELDRKKWKNCNLKSAVFTKDVNDILNDPDIDIVVELIGGCKIAKSIVLEALKKGKAVVTANKALLAEDGKNIFKTAEKYGSEIYYEASVAGGIPIIKILRESLVSSKINSILSIVNGTSNYILTKMQEEGADFKQALAEAKKEGYAERNPKFDILGIDSAHKLAILSSLAMGKWVDFNKVYVEGITHITHSDILYADELGYVIKLLAICKYKNGEIEVRVHPTLLPKHHVLSNINGVYNAVFVSADNAGNQLFYGRGAGKMPAGSAVASDIIDVARNIASGIKCRIPTIRYTNRVKRIKPMDKVKSQCYLRITTMDRPGVLSKISGILGKNKISISSVMQKKRHRVNAVPIVITIHKAPEKNIKRALNKIDKLPEIKAKTVMIRMEG